MFGISRKEKQVEQPQVQQQAIPVVHTPSQVREALTKKIGSVIGNGSTVVGEVMVRRGIKVDGQIEGNLMVESDEDTVVVIGQTGVVKGNVICQHVIVLGHVEGSIQAADTVEMGEMSVLTGDLEYGMLTFHDGAVIEGRLKRVNTVTQMPARRFANG